MNLILIIFKSLFLLTSIGMLIYKYSVRKKRTKYFYFYTSKHGLKFYEKDEIGPLDKLDYYKYLNVGSSRKIFNTIFFDFKGIRAVFFDHHYVISNKDGAIPYSHSFFVLKHNLYVPGLLIRKENFGDKLISTVGFDDINFESAEFSKEFYISSPNRKFAYDVIHPKMMEFLMRKGTFIIGFERDKIFIHTGNMFSLADIRAAYRTAIDFYNLIPDFVKKDYRRHHWL